MTDRRIEPQASSLPVRIYRENGCATIARIRCLAAPPYDGWMRLSADLQQARQLLAQREGDKSSTHIRKRRR